MVTAVTPVAILEATPATAPRAPAVSPVQAAEPAPSLRLVIEEDAGSGQFVYKTMDRVTGEVVSQLPREDVIKMGRDAAYQPGDLIETDV